MTRSGRAAQRDRHLPSGNDRAVGRTSVRSVPTERALTSRTRRRVASKIRTEEVWTSTVTCWRSGRRDALRRVGGRGTQLRTAGVYCTFLGFSSGPLFPTFFLFPAVFGFLPGGGTTRRSDSVIGQYLNDILDLSVVVDTTRPGRSRYPAPWRMSPFHTHKIVSVAPKDIWDFFGSAWPSANSALWAVTIVFATVRERGRVAQTTVCVVRFWFPVKRNSCYPDNDASNDPLGMSDH